MKSYDIPVACDVRLHGSVRVEASSFEEAVRKIDAEYVAKNLESSIDHSDDVDFDFPREISLLVGGIAEDYGENFSGPEFIDLPAPWEKRDVYVASFGMRDEEEWVVFDSLSKARKWIKGKTEYHMDEGDPHGMRFQIRKASFQP